MQRKVPQIQTVLRTVESPPVQFAGRVVDVPVIRQMDLENNHVKIPQIQYIDEAVDVLVGMLRLVPRIQTGLKTG